MSSDAETPPSAVAESASAAAPVPSDTLPDSVVQSPAVIEKVLSLINDARVKNGLAQSVSQAMQPLKPNGLLVKAAQEHAEDMVKKGYFDYSPTDGGEGVEARLRRIGYLGRTGFSLARRRPTPEDAVSCWLDDATSRTGLFDPDHRELGVGTYQGYWTLLVGTPEQVISDPLRSRMLELFNQLRASYSIPPLELDKQLNYIAQTHSLDMAKRGFFAHVCPDGKNVTTRAMAVDYNAVVIELISGALGVEDAFAEWNANGAFKSQMLNDNNRRIGVGLFGGKWTVVLGLPPPVSNVVVKSGDELKSELEGLCNKLRVESKVPPLKAHAGLQQVATAHAADMAAKNFLAYDYPGCPGIAGRVRELGYRGRFFPAITKGPTTAEAVFKLFADSPGHRKNLVDPEFRDVAIVGKDGVWVLLLGAPAPEVGSDLRGELLRLINAQRTASSVAPMSQSSLLNHVAQDYAQDMVRRTFFAYTNPEGKGPDALARSDGFPGQVFPSLARGASAPEVALAAWLKSAPTRTALLDPNFSLVGVGMSEAHWVLLLGSATP